jgi:hypothetical protein
LEAQANFERRRQFQQDTRQAQQDTEAAAARAEAQRVAQEQFVGGLSAARDIHRTASHYTSEVLFNTRRASVAPDTTAWCPAALATPKPLNGCTNCPPALEI